MDSDPGVLGSSPTRGSYLLQVRNFQLIKQPSKINFDFGRNFISIQQNWRLALAHIYSKEMRENKKQSSLFIFYFFSTPYNIELTFTYLWTLWYLQPQSLLCPPLLQIHPRISHQKWRIKNAIGGFPASNFYFYF